MAKEARVPAIKSIFLEVEEDAYQVGKHHPKTLEVSIVDATVVAGIPHEFLKRQLAALTRIPTTEITRVYTYGDIKTWYVCIGSQDMFNKLHMTEHGLRRRPGSSMDRFTVHMIACMHAEKKGIRGSSSGSPLITQNPNLRVSSQVYARRKLSNV